MANPSPEPLPAPHQHGSLAPAPDPRRPPPVPRAPAGTAAAAGPPPPDPDRSQVGRPTYYPSTFSWLGVGIGRNWRGVVGALVSTWFNVPFAMVLAVVGAVVFGVGGFIVGEIVVARRFFDWLVADVALFQRVLDAFLAGPTGVVGALLGVLLGLVLGFATGLLLTPGLLFSADPLTGTAGVLGMVALGLIFGVLYTLLRIGIEGRILRLAGARQMSRREQALIVPIVQSCTRRLGLAGHPPVLMTDSREPGATAHARHLVINRGLLEEFDYDSEVLAAVVCHELVHWRNGDPISAAFVRGVALPLYAVHGGASWLIRKVEHRLFYALVWFLLWPVAVTVKYIIMPLQAADTRRAEFRADQGAVLAGHRDGMRRVLERLRGSFEGGRSGWTEAVCATHPPNELRLERLEDPTRTYPLPDRRPG